MRDKTDCFVCQQDPTMDKLNAWKSENEVVVQFYNDDCAGDTVFMSRSQAEKFAKQVLEMCEGLEK